MFLVIGAVDALEDIAALLGHDDDPRRAPQQSLHHAALVGAGPFEHGVERGDDGDREPVGQRDQEVARRAAIDAIFVLDPQRLRAARLDRAGGVEISGAIMLFGSRH
jgi:hypothetical protein